MTHTDGKVKWITRTALCTALVLLAQIVGKMLPAGAVIAGPFSINQLVTGSLVNLVLILAAASVGLWSGVACGVVSSILAALLGMTPGALYRTRDRAGERGDRGGGVVFPREIARHGRRVAGRVGRRPVRNARRCG